MTCMSLVCHLHSQSPFQVMIQPHNRHMSFSVYISALAVADTTVLLNGKSSEYNTFDTFFCE